MKIRRFKEADAEEIARLVCRNLIEVNSRDYAVEDMRKLAAEFNADKIKNIASYAHMYVVFDKITIIGTGSISSFWGSLTESILLTIFVLPEYQHIGIGRKIIEVLESDDLYLRSDRIEIPASITACGFYEKMGYQYKDYSKQPDEEGHICMEKYTSVNVG